MQVGQLDERAFRAHAAEVARELAGDLRNPSLKPFEKCDALQGLQLFDDQQSTVRMRHAGQIFAGQHIEQLLGLRGVRRARFMGVLHGHRHPAVLIEGGFLSNLHEANQIESGVFRQKLAVAVAGALK